MGISIIRNPSDWADQAGSYDNVSSGYGDTSTELTNDQQTPPTISYPSSDIETVGIGWNTWSGGYSGEVVIASGDSMTIDLSGVVAFGFELEPNIYQTESLTVTLSNGKTVTDTINGDHGAHFFGFVGTGITSITITDNSDDYFAIGNFEVQQSLGLDYRLYNSATSDSIAANAATLASEFNFLGEYLGGNASYLSAATASALNSAGLEIVSLYENKYMKEASYFASNALQNGIKIGKAAYKDAVDAGQNAHSGSAIYFAVDFDASGSDLTGVASFFQGIAKGFQHEANLLTGGDVLFKIGVYGSGLTDNTMVNDGLAAFSWLAESTGWTDSNTYTGWDIKQVADPGHAMASQMMSSVDFSASTYDAMDLLNGSVYGQW